MCRSGRAEEGGVTSIGSWQALVMQECGGGLRDGLDLSSHSTHVQMEEWKPREGSCQPPGDSRARLGQSGA